MLNFHRDRSVLQKDISDYAVENRHFALAPTGYVLRRLLPCLRRFSLRLLGTSNIVDVGNIGDSGVRVRLRYRGVGRIR